MSIQPYTVEEQADGYYRFVSPDGGRTTSMRCETRAAAEIEAIGLSAWDYSQKAVEEVYGDRRLMFRLSCGHKRAGYDIHRDDGRVKCPYCYRDALKELMP